MQDFSIKGVVGKRPCEHRGLLGLVAAAVQRFTIAHGFVFI